MEYIGHKSDDGVNREQALIEHLNGTSALCSEFARRFTMEEIGKLLGLYHDVGKYSIGFQKRIQLQGHNYLENILCHLLFVLQAIIVV